jgi:hypothetical protein
MTKIYIAFYDDEDGGSRENWNTFYTPWVASTTYEGAEKLAKAAIAASIADDVKYEFDVDLATVDRSTLDKEVIDFIQREESRYHIEIQEGDLE